MKNDLMKNAFVSDNNSNKLINERFDWVNHLK